MEYSNTQALMERIEDYIVKSKLYLEAQHYDKLAELEQDALQLSEDLRDIPADTLQMFHTEIARFDAQLLDVRDSMIARRETIREQLSQMGENSHAAKAYLKSSMEGE